jgi:hypothetical protein
MSDRTRPSPARGRAALVVAHPGHELCVYGWLERARPRVFVLTDGSGRSGRSRIASTDAVLDAVGAEPGGVYARLTDAGLYAAILDGDFALFNGLADELAREFVAEGVEYVVGDAAEGYNPAHDACRLVLDAAAALARKETGGAVGNFEFPLVGRPDARPEKVGEGRWLRLGDEAFARKIRAARNYPELAGEVEAALAGEGSTGLREHPDIAARTGLGASAAPGAEAFRVECLRAAAPGAAGDRWLTQPPFYESYGERQVAAGHYARVLRYREHMLPLAEALRSHVGRRNR